MDHRIAKAGLDFLFENRGDLSSCIVGFFGGEPFLNWPVMKWAIEYAQKVADSQAVDLIFSITTNGTILTDEYLDLLDRYNTKLTFSIDGPAEIHNKERRFVNGQDTYERVEHNIFKALSRSNIICQARPTLTPESCGMLVEIYQHFRNLGLCRMHARPESRYGNRPGLSGQQYNQLVSSLEYLAKEMIVAVDNGEFWGATNILKFLNMLYFRVVRHDFCGAGTSIVSISPDGLIFPCPRYTGEEQFCLGNVFVGIDSDKRSFFFDNVVDNRVDCQGCWARYVCGGGCSYMHWITTGDIERNDDAWCDLTKRSIEIAIKSYAQLQAGDEDRVKELFLRFKPFLSDFGDGADDIFGINPRKRREWS